MTNEINTNNPNVTPPHAASRRSAAGVLLAIAGLLCVAAIIWWFGSGGPVIPNGVNESDYKLAAKRFQRSYKRTPDHQDVLMMTAELAVQHNDSATAIAAFASIPDEHPEYGPSARFQEAQVLVRDHQARRAELSFRRFLQLADGNDNVSQPDIMVARRWLSFLLSVELRLDERSEILAAAHESQQINVADSKQYYFPRLLIWKSSSGRRRLNEFIERDPHDFLLNVALGRYLTGEGKLQEARTLLELLRQQFPNHPDGIVALLECCFEQNDWKAMKSLLNSVSAYQSGERHFLTRIRGELALHDHRWEDAVLEFTRATESDSADPAVTMGLAKAFGQLGRTQEQQAAQQRSLVLSQVRVDMARNNEQSVEPLVKLAERCREINMPKAADTFLWHSQRIQRLPEGNGVSQ